MATERNTEALTRDLLKDKNYYVDIIKIEEQQSDNKKIKSLLKTASKKLTGKPGYPEFIITKNGEPDTVVVIECKKDTNKHMSETFDKVADYAVDGALHYASFLSKSYNVIAIGISGVSKNNYKINTYKWIKGADNYEAIGEELLSFDNFMRIINEDPVVIQHKEANLKAYSRELHNYLRDYAKVSESEKPLLVSAILIALEDNIFAYAYNRFSDGRELANELINSIERVLKRSEVPDFKINNLLQIFNFITIHPELIKSNNGKSKSGVLKELIDDIYSEVKPFINAYNSYDVIGSFYGEFLRYAGGDGKGLGIVLTPKHITELFCDLAQLTVNSTVLDICTGTTGYLIAAMNNMVKKANGNEEIITHIKKHQLIGCEQQPSMYALGVSNMILRGDGKANIYLGSCFDKTEELKSHRANIGLINPPYSQKGEGLSELDFIDHMLDCLEPNGTGIAIVPMSAAIDTRNSKREAMLKKHTLEAVMSMPPKLFDDIGTITCIMVFKAHVPHNSSNPSWFALWKDDGFEKVKNEGRVDVKGKWENIKNTWLTQYRYKSEIPGLCVKAEVDHTMEWCAEAYIDTDYSLITDEDFEIEIKKYIIFNLLNGDLNIEAEEEDEVLERIRR